MYLTNKGLLANARRILAVTVSGGFLFLQFLQAADTIPVLPSNGAYVAGSGSIKASGNAVTINQSTLRGVIDWNNFSIGQGGMVTFKNGAGATLNRVTGNQMSSIMGSLFASGSVYLINPQGVLIGPNAHVHTGGDFLASTLNISPAAFMQGGSLVLQGDSKNVVVNLGDLFSSNGSVFLIGHDVSNAGSLHAANGTAGLAAASQVLIKDSTGDQRIFVQGPAGDVTNSGAIQAAQAELKAKGGNIYALAGNNSTIAATGTANIDGKVWLIADGGKTAVASSVSAQNASGVGGAIETSGRSLDISQASIKTGQHGNWLLDPDDQTIDSAAATVIENSLATTNVTITTSATVASGPGIATTGNGDINLNSSIGWASNNSFNVSAYRDINVATGVTISNTGAGNLTLRADNTSSGTGTVNLNGTSMIDWSGSTGIASILYNPAETTGPVFVPNQPLASPIAPLTTAAAYANPTDYSSHILTNTNWTALADHTVSNQVTAYMLVNNGTDLANVPNSGNFALGTDIDISSNPNFTELGKTSPGFTGIFDGFGHTINGLTISTNDGPLGMFQYLGTSGIIRNLNLTELSVTDTTGDFGELGALVGESAGTIANVNATGVVSNQNAPYRTGGLVGYNTASGLIYNVQAHVGVDETSAQDPYASTALGGMVAVSDGTIINSTSTGAILGNGFFINGGTLYMGGLAGVNTGTITNSSASGSITNYNGGFTQAGGLVGANTGNLAGVSASGNVTATSDSGVYIGGLIGSNTAPLYNLSATGTVTSGDNSRAGGLVGHSDGSISSSNAQGAVNVGDISFAGGLVGFITQPVSDSYATGNVTAGNSSTVGALTGWSYFTTISGSHATGNVIGGDYSSVGGLTGRIDGPLTTSYATGAVSGGVGSDIGGLVGVTYSTINSAHATGDVFGGGYSAIGGLAGVADGAVLNSYATGDITGSDTTNAGGLIGVAVGTIDTSYATGAVNLGDNSSVGGLVGIATAAITDSNAQGNVSAGYNGRVGGLVGYANASVDTSSASGTVYVLGNSEGASFTGGLVGLVDTSGSVSNSQATGSVTNAGNGGIIGGLVGLLAGTATTSTATGPVSGGNYTFVGGLFGEADTALSGFTATANVSAGIYSQAGGMVGHMTSNVANSTASGNVTADYGSNVGGLIANTTSDITNSSASGIVTGVADNFVGGLVGYSNGVTSESSASGLVYSTGAGDSGITAAGGLVGYLDSNGSITTSQASGNVTHTGTYGSVGGLVGILKGGLASSSSTGAVTGGVNTWVGGLVGEAHVALDGLTSSVQTIGGSGSVVGGLVGYTDSAISNSTASGNVSAGDSGTAGGLVGVSDVVSENDSILNSSASGNVIVTARATAGGLAGYAGGIVGNSFATGHVQGGDHAAIGGLIGEAGGNVDSSYASGNVTTGPANIDDEPGSSDAGGLIGYVDPGGSVSNSHASGTVTGGDFSSIGGLVGFSEGPISQSYATGMVTAGIAANAGGLAGVTFSDISNSYATGNVTVGSGIDWNLAPPNPGAYAGGLVGQTVENATITNSYATGDVVTGDFSYAGGLAGWTSGSVTGSRASGNVTAGASADAGGLMGGNWASVSNSYATGNVLGADNSYVGGLVGDASGSIASSYATGNVSAGTSATADAGCGGCTAAGGLVGNTYVPISTSFATGNVSASGVGAWAGGLVGTAWAGADISQSYSTGQVSASGANVIAGGLVGDMQSAVIDSYSTGAVNASGVGSIAGGLVGVLDIGQVDPPATPSISSSYSIGAVSGADMMGGLVGLNTTSENITSSFWDITTSGQSTSDGGTGLTTSQWLLFGPVATNDEAWDLTNNWVAGYPYPVLRAFPYVVANLATNGHRIYGQTDPGITITSATDQNSNDALSSIQGTLTPVTAGQNTHVGTYGIGGSGQTVPNHQLTYLGFETIDPLAIVLGGNGANNKTYDGTLNTTLSPDGFYVANLVGSDNIMLNISNASATFDNKNVGNGKAVDVTGLTLTGPDAANYIVSNSYQTTANITPATLTATFTANNKVYDGTTTATASVSGLNGVIGPDSVGLQNASFDFASKNAGGVNPVSGSNYVLTGPDAGNYVVTFVQNGSASITPATLYYVGQPGTNRPFGADNPAFNGTVSGFVGGDTLASTTTGFAVFSTSATTMSNAGSYGLYGSGLTLTTGNYTLAQAPGNDTAFTINPITISIGNVNRFVGSANPPFTINYSGPMTPYLQSLLSSLVLVTNAPATDTAGSYQINALIPAELAGDIIVNPGSLNILSNINNSINPATPQSISTLPSALSTQTVPPPFPLTAVGGSTSGNAVLPTNANGLFQIVINPSPDWTASGQNPSQGGALSSASFTEKSPDGHSKKKNSIYSAGAH